ncbi:hypothetical protein RB595_006206 [Gaeumannomyces hyphopodioides]
MHISNLNACLCSLVGLVALVTASSAKGISRVLYVSNYAGLISKLALTGTAKPFELREVASTVDCGLNPAWLEIDRLSGNILCLNEAYTLTNSGSVASFDKDLALLSNQTVLAGPAASVQYANGRLALAHMEAGGVSVMDTSVTPPRTLQELTYDLATPGPNATLQYKPFVHGVAVEPAGRFVVAFDRGADILRVYSVGGPDQLLVEQGGLAAKPGSGPRHGVFVRGEGEKTFLYVLGELDNSVMGFEAIYEPDASIPRTMHLRPIFSRPIEYGEPGVAVPSEILAHDGGRHVVLSLRNDDRSIYDGRAGDTIFTYRVDPATGALVLIRATASGGRWPRSFAVTSDGTLIAVGNQYSRPGSVVVFARDPATGVIDDSEAVAVWTTEAALPDGGSISMLRWDD